MLIELEAGQPSQGVGRGAAGVDLDGAVAIGHRLLQLVLGRVGLGAADVTDGVGGGQADAGREIVDRLGQLALLLAVLAADAVGQDAGRVELDRLLAIGQGGGEVFQAHADRCPRGVRLRMTGIQLQHGREVGQRGLEIGLGRVPRRQGRSRRMLARTNSASQCFGSSASTRFRSARALSNMPRVANSRALAKQPLGFVRFEFDGRGGVVQRPVGFPQDVERPGPGHDRIRPPRPPPDGLVEVLQGLFLFSGHAVADAAGQVGLGDLGCRARSAGCSRRWPGRTALGCGRSMPARHRACPSGDGAGSAPRSGRACTILRGGRAGAWLPPTGLHHAIQARRRAAPDRATSRPAFCQRICRENAIML